MNFLGARRLSDDGSLLDNTVNLIGRTCHGAAGFLIRWPFLKAAPIKDKAMTMRSHLTTIGFVLVRGARA